MTLTNAAQKVFEAAHSDDFESMDAALKEFDAQVNLGVATSDLISAQSILADARMTSYVNRSRIIHSLQQLSRSVAYSGEPSCNQSWEFSA